MSIQKQIKRNKQQQNKINVVSLLEKSFKEGYEHGKKDQLELDIKAMTRVLGKLEDVKGVGTKLADEIRIFFLNEIGKRD